nr:glyceraldehyde-3-phosphate dehydrogenase-like [Rattus norvegicus]
MAAASSNKMEIIIINDPFTDLNYVVYMFQHDSTHGKFNDTVKAENGKFVIDGMPITIFQERDPANIRWGDDAGVEYVVELSAIFTTMGKIGAYLKVPPMYEPCVNHKKYDNSLKIVSIVSCTTNYLVPLTKLIHDNFAIMAVGKVTPEVNGMLTGMAFNVLIPNVLVMDLTCHLEKAAKYDDIKKVVNQASEDSLMDILGYIEDQVVSCMLIK